MAAVAAAAVMDPDPFTNCKSIAVGKKSNLAVNTIKLKMDINTEPKILSTL